MLQILKLHIDNKSMNNYAKTSFDSEPFILAVVFWTCSDLIRFTTIPSGLYPSLILNLNIVLSKIKTDLYMRS